MKRLSMLSAVFVVSASLAAGLAAQTKPDFSGSWKIAPGGSADMFTPPALAVVQDATTLTVTSSSEMGEFKTTYNLDGTNGRSPIDFGGNVIERTTKLARDGEKLVLTTTSDFGGQVIEFKQIWSIAADGSLEVEATRPDFEGGGAPVTTKATYKKS